MTQYLKSYPLLTAGLVLALASCKPSTRQDRSEARPATVPAPTVAGVPPQPPAKLGTGSSGEAGAEVDPSDDKAIRAQLEAWVRSQNQGDFTAYERLYAEKFTGIKQSGDRSFQAGREDWLKDRKAMFARPLTVTTENVVVSGGGAFARVRFIQDFRTPTFHDRGPKELQLVKAGPGWQIAREEMLSSIVGDTKAIAKRVLPSDFAFVREVPGGTVILLDRYANLNPVHGTPVHVRDGVVLRPVRQDLVEDEFRSLVGKQFRVYTADGAACDLIPEELTIYAESTPHFGTLATWHGEGPDRRVYSEAERALESWRMIGDERWIALFSKKSCPGIWARRAEAAAPTFYKVARNKVPIDEAALASLGTTTAYQEMQSWARKNLADATPRTGTQAFEGPNGVQYVTAFAEFGVGYCAEYGGRHFGIFRRTGEAVTLLTDPLESYGAGPLGRAYDVTRERGLPSSAVDLDGDGRPEFVFENVLFGQAGERYQIIREARMIDFDCHC